MAVTSVIAHATGSAVAGRHPMVPPRRRVLPRALTALRVLAGFYLLLLLCLAALTVLPGMAGWHPYVMTSDSMAPVMPVGDVALASDTAARNLRPGDIVVVRDPARHGAVLAHRLVRQLPNGDLITKGDANPLPDSTPVPPGMVIGKVRAVVPAIGLIPHWWSHDRSAFAGLLLTV